MQEIIKVEGLTKTYGGVPAADNISLSVSRGQVFGLLGPNGAGKTTTLECILGIRPADKGEVSILGMNPLSDRKRLFEKVGVQFQEADYQDNIKVGELCQVAASLYRNAADPPELLKKFGISSKCNSLVKDLSGGQRQRLSIVLALIPRPEVVFLDELTTGLDTKARREVWNILKNLKEEGLTIFLTSHFMDEVEALCDCVCILKGGEIIFYGKVSQAIEASPCDTLEEAYLWHTKEEGAPDESF